MIGQKPRQMRKDVQPGERGRSRQAQLSRQSLARAARGKFGFIGFLQRAARAFVKALPRFGGREPVRGARHQSDAEPVFELRNRL